MRSINIMQYNAALYNSMPASAGWSWSRGPCVDIAQGIPRAKPSY